MSSIDWEKYYLAQIGGEYNYFRGSNFQQGYGLNYQQGAGLGTMFRKFASWVVPIFKKHALPVIESGIKTVGKEALDSAADVAKDIISGKNLKEASSERLISAIDNLKQKAENKLQGKGIKRKKKLKNLVIFKNKKTRFQDIFD
jgi:hypothetical protein